MTEEMFSDLFRQLCLSKAKDFKSDICRLWYEKLKDFQTKALIKAFQIYMDAADPYLVLGKMIEIVKPEIKEPLALPRPPLTVEERQKVLDRLQGIITMLAESKDIENLEAEGK